jgi:hypothetical protein
VEGWRGWGGVGWRSGRVGEGRGGGGGGGKVKSMERRSGAKSDFRDTVPPHIHSTTLLISTAPPCSYPQHHPAHIHSTTQLISTAPPLRTDDDACEDE